jgi:uncharacterized membrane protein
MKRNTFLRLLAILAIVAVIVVVAGVAAYHFGVTSGPNNAVIHSMPFRGRGVGMNSEWPGLGLVGLVGVVLLVILFFWLLAAILSPDRGRAAGQTVQSPGTSAAPAAGDVDRLRELSELHTAGKLTDEEFTAAKRKLLGLQ